MIKALAFQKLLIHNANDYYLDLFIIVLLKLSQAKAGKHYKVEDMTALQVLSKRLAILGVNTGVLIELLSLYKHGAVVKTPCGDIALGSDLLDAIMVKAV